MPRKVRGPGTVVEENSTSSPGLVGAIVDTTTLEPIDVYGSYGKGYYGLGLYGGPMSSTTLKLRRQTS